MGTTLPDLADALRVLHRSLLDAARAEYEEQHGRIEGPYSLLHLASTHPVFAFLHSLSELMVDLDVLLEQQEAERPVPGQAVAEELRALLGLGGEDAEFANRYRHFLQRDPDVVVAHAHLLTVLRGLPVRGDEAAFLHEKHQWAMVRRQRDPSAESAATVGGGPVIEESVLDEEVDEASRESFPASDAPGWIDHGGH